LGFEKKSARWVPELLADNQKQQHVEFYSEFIAVVQHHSIAMLDLIITMDKMVVCYHTPQMKSRLSSGSRKGSRAQ
jgi:uncharacterized membrane protein YbaN (DUF454 family)